MACVSAEPVQYRPNLRVRMLEKQTAKSADVESVDATKDEGTTIEPLDQPADAPTETTNGRVKEVELDDEEEDSKVEKVTEAHATEGPYPPSGTKPSGRLLNVPREIAHADTTTAEPSDTTEFTTVESSTTEEFDATTTTDEAVTDEILAKTGIETTSEPDAESVDVDEVAARSEPEPEAAVVPSAVPAAVPPPVVSPGGYFFQLPNGSFQRVMYFSPSNGLPVGANLEIQPVIQAQQPTVVNSFVSTPRFVTFSSQYQSW